MLVCDGPFEPVGAAAVAGLLLSDSRLPSGTHAHSGGMEEAVESGSVREVADLLSWCAGALWTVGLVGAGLAAAACRLAVDSTRSGTQTWPTWEGLDAEADARLPSPAQRVTSRRLGRQLLRTARRLWSSTALDRLDLAAPSGPHRAMVLGATMAAAGGGSAESARAEAYSSVAGPASAAVRLLGLDPVEASAVLVTLAGEISAVTRMAVELAGGSWADLPACGSPLLDQLAERHASRGGTLFAS